MARKKNLGDRIVEAVGKGRRTGNNNTERKVIKEIKTGLQTKRKKKK